MRQGVGQSISAPLLAAHRLALPTQVASARNLVEVEAEAELYLGALQRVTHSIAASIGR